MKPGAIAVWCLLCVAALIAAEPAANDFEPLRPMWEKEQYQFTPALKAAWLAVVKDRVRQQLVAADKSIPEDFWGWIDSDPLVEAAVYGARQDAAGVVLMLRSLELDLGPDVVRSRYTQLALATAVVFAKQGAAADLTPRPMIALNIGGDPRIPVDTKEPGRELDVNDHIINFLNDNTIEENVVIGHEPEVPELKYDSNGVAIPPPKVKGKAKMVPIYEKQTRTLYAADVIASVALQEKFNAYMQEKGQAVRIECGDRVVHWSSHDMVRGEPYKKIAAAYKMFRTAYEAKGLLPEKRDPIPTPAERCAYLIRNFEYVFPDDLQGQRKWPRYPLTAPWPTLTLLVANDQPLREREERWLAFRDKGEFRTYGEYIGSIAQQGDMQSARRLKPYPYTYGSIQMMLKDGGVCGVMANIGVRSNIVAGIPACTAGQPGHCALISFAFDPKSGTYICRGGQYATGGDDKTSPHTPWPFGDVDARRPMVYYQSIAWAVNYGLPEYLDSTLAYAFFLGLPEAERRAHGLSLLKSSVDLNPYNFLPIDAGLSLAPTAEELIDFWRGAVGAIAAGKRAGCPDSGLYVTTIKDKLFNQLGKVPLPEDDAAASAMLAFLETEKCSDAATLMRCRIRCMGLDAVLAQTAAALANHLTSARTDAACIRLAADIKAAADAISDRKQRQAWATACWLQIQGHERYLDSKSVIQIDAAVAVLAKLSGQKQRPEAAQFQPVLDTIVVQFQAEIEAGRTVKGCTQMAKKIEAVAGQIKSADQKGEWLTALAQAVHGKETYTINGKVVRDPSADAIQKLQQPPAPEVAP